MSYETRRLEELFKYFQATSDSIGNDIDTVPGYLPDLAQLSLDPVLNALAQLGTYRLNCDRAFISLIDDEYQYVVAEATQSISLLDSKLHRPDNGLCIGARRLDLFAGVCAGTMPAFTGSAENEVVSTSNIYADHTRYIINDFTQEALYKDRPYVVDFPYMRYYAEVPIKTANGYVIGTYSVVDNQPRVGLSDEGYTLLTEIALSIMRHLEYVKLKEDHRQASYLLQGLNSFVQGDVKNQAEISDKHHASEHLHVSSNHNTSVAAGVRNQATTFKPPLLRRETLSTDSEMETIDTRSEKSFPGQSTTTDPSSFKPNKQLASDLGLGMSGSASASGEAIGSDDMSTTDDVYVSFLRASHILRTAMDLDGVIFLNANQNGHQARNERSKETVSFDTVGLLQSAPVTSEDEMDQQEKKRYAIPITENDLQDTVMGTSLPKVHPRVPTQMAGRLGYSTSTEPNPPTSVISADHFSLPEDLHLRLLRYYPRGSVFHLGRDRAPPSAFQEPHTPQVSMAEIVDGSHKDLKKSRSKEKRRRKIMNEMRLYLPGAQYVIFLPLWNPHKDTWFAGSLGWTNNDKKILQSEDFAYFSVFGNTIMAEVTRLELLATDRAKSDFISSISHELRSPLHGILGSAEILKESNIDAEQEQMVGMVESCGRILLDTMDHILYFSKINSISIRGKRHRRRRTTVKAPPKVLLEQASSFDLSLLVEETVESLLMGHRSGQSLTQRFSAPTSSQVQGSSWRHADSDQLEATTPQSVAVILHVENCPSWVVHSEPTAWRRVLMNLLGNALKYTENGFIEVLLTTISHAKTSESDNFDRTISLAINDTGRGISKTYLHTHLYTPFVQENSLSNGTGLGLSIVEKIVTGLGGTLEIQSEVGIGTQAFASIPVISAKEQTGATLLNPEQYRECTLCLLGFDVYPDMDVAALGFLPVPSKMLLSLKKVLRDYAEERLGMKVSSVQSMDQVRYVEDYHVIAVCEHNLHLLEDETEKKAEQITIPANCSILVVCTDQKPVGSSKRITSSKVQHITQPFGPRKLADALQSVLQQPSSSSHQYLYKENTISLQPATSFPGTRAPDLEREPQSLPSKSTLQEGMEKISLSSPLNGAPDAFNKRPHVLLVEDNDINMSILVKYMIRIGCSYDTAMNGKEALSSFTNCSSPSFDLILMDINMPIMDGFAATRAIRNWEKGNERVGSSPVPIVALTGLGSAEAQQEAFASGVDVFLTKPVKMATVRTLIEYGVETFLDDKGS